MFNSFSLWFHFHSCYALFITHLKKKITAICASRHKKLKISRPPQALLAGEKEQCFSTRTMDEINSSDSERNMSCVREGINLSF
ncbi:MAG: hypothetical protein CSA81_00860 [Acidobacteria bacterium]|nr:MAG: hypothetical protein CSA81_00860 [Acidobacteriota bacterium]